MKVINKPRHESLNGVNILFVIKFSFFHLLSKKKRKKDTIKVTNAWNELPLKASNVKIKINKKFINKSI